MSAIDDFLADQAQQQQQLLPPTVAAAGGGSVDALFDLAAPTVELPCVALLVPLHSTSSAERAQCVEQAPAAAVAAANQQQQTDELARRERLCARDNTYCSQLRQLLRRAGVRTERLELRPTSPQTTSTTETTTSSSSPSSSSTSSVVDVTVGRSVSLRAPLRIDCPRLSNQHCRFTVQAASSSLFVTDTSSNGVWVNSVRIAKNVAHPLAVGDVVSLLKPTEFMNDDGDDEDNNNSDDDGSGGGGASSSSAPPQVSIQFLVAPPSWGVQRRQQKARQRRRGGQFDGDSDGDAHRDTSSMPRGDDSSSGRRRQRSGSWSSAGARGLSDDDNEDRRHGDAASLAGEEASSRLSEDQIQADIDSMLTVLSSLRHINNSANDDDGQLVIAMPPSSAETTLSFRYHQVAAAASAAAAGGGGASSSSVPVAAQHQLFNGFSFSSLRCDFCSRPDPRDQFRCPPGGGAPHLVCCQCSRVFPDRTPRRLLMSPPSSSPSPSSLPPVVSAPQRCACCDRAFCHASYGPCGGGSTVVSSSPMSAATAGGGAASSASSARNRQSHPQQQQPQISQQQNEFLLPLRQHQVHALPRHLFHGNSIELWRLLRYILRSKQSIVQVWSECLVNFAAGRWDVDVSTAVASSSSSSSSSLFSAVAAQTNVNDSRPRLLTVDSAVCSTCATERVFASLLLHFCTSVPRQAWAGDLADRPNCWHGLGCKAMLTNLAHRRQFNHVCIPRKAKE